jgi:site-specific DNA-methyltransferase (adenine-specific)
MMDNTRVFNMDCMEGMKEFPDKYFDLAIVDPGYGIGENKGQHKSRNANRIDRRNGKPIIIKHKGYPVKEWDNERPSIEYFKELFRVSKNQIVFGGNYFADLFPASSCWIVWDKVNGESDFADCELAWTSFKSAVRQFRFMWSGFCQGKSITEGHINQGNKELCERRLHPTQKPIKLYKWLLKNYAKEGDKILDTHLGSQSSRIAAFDGGFDFTGYELDKDYFEAGNKRFAQHKAQLKLFTPSRV